MKIKRVMIAAPKSGSGKTTMTCALLQSLKNSGKQVIAYKCGPDYIDPMFHEKVIGIPSKNLDTFFTDEETTKALFIKNRTEEEFAVLEGVMGLFDGLGGIREEGSSYHLAKVTNTPIVLVVDAKGMGRSILPLIAGFLAYDKARLIQGIILNRMSKAYYEIIKPLIEEELKISVLGYFPEYKEFQIESRHLGLKLPGEVEHIKEQLLAVAEKLEETVSVKDIVRIAETAEEIGTDDKSIKSMDSVQSEVGQLPDCRPVLAVARDEAFCFYYADNLLLLQENGVRIQYFSPLHDKQLPLDCKGLLLGGGYPELYAQALSHNKEMLAAVRQAICQGMPTVAECGGFMYLHTAIVDKDGRRYPMVGALPSICHDTGKLVRFGYVEVEEKQSRFLPEGQRIRGHEFHYFDSADNGKDCLAIKPVTGKSYPCVVAGENYWFGFPHLYYPSNPSFVEKFTEKIKRYSALQSELN